MRRPATNNGVGSRPTAVAKKHVTALIPDFVVRFIVLKHENM